MSPFETYLKFLGIKYHFCKPKYDYFKYQGKTRASIDAFNKRRDKYWYEKTSRKYSDKEITDFFVSNFALSYNPQTLWIGQIINSGEETYAEWMRRQQSLTYLFKEQSTELFSENEFNSVFDCSKGHPILLKKYLGGSLYLENLVIYEKIFSFAKNFDKTFSDPVWESVSLKLSKYAPFLNIETPRYKKILKEILGC
jgi:hypothetical protein